MKKIVIFFTCFTFFAFLLNNCSETSNPVNSQLDQKSNLLKGKPIKEEPEIVDFSVVNHTEAKTIPGEPVIIHYKVKNARTVDLMAIHFRYDHDGDGEHRGFFDPFVYTHYFSGNGEDVQEGNFNWYGTVRPDFSSDPDSILFDQYATGNPDRYLLQFAVSGRNSWTTNYPVEEDDKVLINHVNADLPMGPFWVTSVEIFSQPPAKKKDQKKYAAELRFKVTCSEPGFKGIGKWVTDDGEIGCCPNIGFNSEGENYAERLDNLVLVKPGTYSFYVKNVYSPNYSYDPWNEAQSNQWQWPEEPCAEVVVH